MTIRTKIIATIGPATGTAEKIRALVDAGCDAFRINFSHGDLEQRAGFLRDIRAVEDEVGRGIAVIADLCGPKIRVGPIAGGSVLLSDGQETVVRRDPVEGTADRISTTLAELVDFVGEGESILLDDGKLRLEVVEARPPEELLCRVAAGGVLASGKGVNLPRTHLPLSPLTEKDGDDLTWIVSEEFDYVAMSFVRSAEDVSALEAVLDRAGCGAQIIAKIEKPEAVDHIEEIVSAADAVMVARGDLGVEMDLPAVPVAQKRIARVCQAAGKPCIIATQMLDSMRTCPTPTRAEVSDVANAVLDHADAVMLSGETAVGKYPEQAVKLMNRIVTEVQAYHDDTASPMWIAGAEATMASLAAAVRDIAASERVVAVAAFTLTGTTARMLAKSRLSVPIIGVSPSLGTVRRMCLYYGVEGVHDNSLKRTRDVLEIAARFAVELGIAKSGDRIVVLSGRPLGEPGATNTLVVHTVP